MTRRILPVLTLPFIALTVSSCASRPPADQPIARPRVAGVPVQSASASLWNQDPESLFGNRRARGPGDILTVIVSVDDEAEMRNSLDATRNYAQTAGVTTFGGLETLAPNILPNGAGLAPAIDLSRNQASAGDGRIIRQETVTLELAAMVISQTPNGLFEIEGTQRIRVNNETRDLKVHGFVRPEDITRDNTITHDHIASADIVYSGSGQIARTTERRWGARLVDLLVPF